MEWIPKYDAQFIYLKDILLFMLKIVELRHFFHKMPNPPKKKFDAGKKELQIYLVWPKITDWF